MLQTNTNNSPISASDQPLSSETDKDSASNIHEPVVVGQAIYTADYLRRQFGSSLYRRLAEICPPVQGLHLGHSWLLAFQRCAGSSAAVQGVQRQTAILTLSEAAEYLDMSERSLRRKVERRLIEYINYNEDVGGNHDLRFTRDALNRYIKARTVPAQDTNVRGIAARLPGARMPYVSAKTKRATSVNKKVGNRVNGRPMKSGVPEST